MGIHTLLIQADIEGIIEAGAPADEYNHEAAQITAAISLRSHEETILAIISLVWMKSFELSDEELQLPLPAIMRGAQEIKKGTKQVPTKILPPSAPSYITANHSIALY